MGIKRVRLNDTSIAGVKVAKKGRIEDSSSGGDTVTVENEYGEARLKAGSKEAVYPTVAAARRAVHRHNPNVEVVKVIAPPKKLRPKTVLPPKNLQPPKPSDPPSKA